jgi:DNA-binding NarL/FixJ family response regulator
MEVVGDASDGISAVSTTQRELPDVVLMDVSMPGATGFQATESVSRTCPGVKVLALTRHTDRAYLHQLIRAGASGYVLKESPASEMLKAIRTVAAGGQYLDPAMSGAVLANYATPLSREPLPVQAALTFREEEVLRLIAWGHSNKEIGTQMKISVKTVEAHRANAMRKLDLRGRIDIVRLALMRGWLRE